MGEFFKGWRRKVGCVTLVMACVFAAGWVRSLAIFDVVSFNQKDATHRVISTRGELRLPRFKPAMASSSEVDVRRRVEASRGRQHLG